MRPRAAVADTVDLDYPEHLRHFRPTEWVTGETWVDGALAWMRARAEWRREHPAYVVRSRESDIRCYFDNLRRDSE